MFDERETELQPVTPISTVQIKRGSYIALQNNPPYARKDNVLLAKS